MMFVKDYITGVWETKKEGKAGKQRSRKTGKQRSREKQKQSSTEVWKAEMQGKAEKRRSREAARGREAKNYKSREAGAGKSRKAKKQKSEEQGNRNPKTCWEGGLSTPQRPGDQMRRERSSSSAWKTRSWSAKLKSGRPKWSSPPQAGAPRGQLLRQPAWRGRPEAPWQAPLRLWAL